MLDFFLMSSFNRTHGFYKRHSLLAWLSGDWREEWIMDPCEGGRVEWDWRQILPLQMKEAFTWWSREEHPPRIGFVTMSRSCRLLINHPPWIELKHIKRNPLIIYLGFGSEPGLATLAPRRKRPVLAHHPRCRWSGRSAGC